MTKFFALLLCLAPLSLPAQDARDIFFADSTEKAYYEIHIAPEPPQAGLSAQTPLAARVVALFRIRRDVLSFSKTEGGLRGGGAFAAFPTATVAFSDADGIIRASREWRDTVYAENLRKTTSQNGYCYGSLTMSLLPGQYAFAFDAGDKSLPRSIKLREKTVVIPRFPNSPDTAALGTPLFGVSRPKAADTLFPTCMNNAIAFGLDGKAWLSVYAPAGSPPPYVWSVRRLRSVAGAAAAAETVCAGKTIFRSALEFAPEERRQAIAARPNGNEQSGIVEISLPGASLEEGDYRLSFARQGAPDTLSYDFGVEWFGKPSSLRNLQYAIDIARYIADDEDYYAMRKVSEPEAREKFEAFWKRRDPTPGTIYNEALYAYYSRADEAFFQFSAPLQGIPDGAKSDRGKVYILCGAPTSVEKRADAAGKASLEIWRYDNKVRKEFTFEVPKSGDYALKNVRDL